MEMIKPLSASEEYKFTPTESPERYQPGNTTTEEIVCWWSHVKAAGLT